MRLLRLAPVLPPLLRLLPAAALAGCAAGDPPQLGYLPPTGPPVNTNRAVVGQPRDLVWNQVIDHLQQQPVELTQIDEQRGIIVARYSGDPEPYVTCGWIVTHRPGDLSQMPASIRQTTLDRIVEGRRMVLERNLRLDGRIVVELVPRGESTVITAQSTYVLTKTVNTGYGGSSVRGRDVQTLSFGTGERGRFEKGTECQPTGALELAALGALPVVASTELEGSVADAREPPSAGERQPLQPFEPPDEEGETQAAATPAAASDGAPAEDGLDCQGADSAYCRLLEITAPYREANRQQQLGLAIEPAGGSTTLEEGSALALSLGLPTYDAHVGVSYLQRDGTVGHILASSSRSFSAGGEHAIDDTGYQIAEPFGREVVVAIATESPLFAEPRPPFEPIESYLAALRERLAELQASDQRIAAAHVLVTTVPSTGSF